MAISSLQFQDFLRQKYANQGIEARARQTAAAADYAGVGQRHQAAMMQYGEGGAEDRAQQQATARQAMEWGPQGARMTMFNQEFPIDSEVKRAQASNLRAQGGMYSKQGGMFDAVAGKTWSEGTAQNLENKFFRGIFKDKTQRYLDESRGRRDAFDLYRSGGVATPGYFSIFNQ